MSNRKIEREAFGVPMVPPGRLAAIADRARRRLRRVHRLSAPPPLQILEALFASFDAQVLRAIVELGIPDMVIEPIPVADLATARGLDSSRLQRLLRHAAARGFLNLDDEGVVSPNVVTVALRSEAVAPWAAWVRFATSDWIADAWQHLAVSLEAASPVAFESAHGCDFFTYTTKLDGDAGETFDAAMRAGATLQAIGVARGFEWSDVNSVCDVGAGDGAALEVLQRYEPHLDVVLFDLPEVCARARSARRDDGPGRRTITSGSFFDTIPAGHDRYLLMAIVHDWDDDAARRLLSNLRDAMAPDSRAIVVENIASDTPRDDFASASDLLMLVLANGRERTERDYHGLFHSAGLNVVGTKLLPTGSTAFVLQC